MQFNPSDSAAPGGNGDDALRPARGDDPHAPGGQAESRSPAGRALSVLALMLSLAALAGSGWLWWGDYRARSTATEQAAADADRIAQLEIGIDSRLSAVETTLGSLDAAASAGEVTALQRRLQAVEAEAREARAEIAERAAWARTVQASMEGNNARLAGIEARLDALAARGLDGAAETDLAELDYLLRLAQERLELFRDVRTADRALALADEHVAAFDNSLFSGLRREIASARRALAAVELPDPAILDRELDMIQDRLYSLPFRGATLDGQALETADSGSWWERLKAAVSGLVTVRRTDEASGQLPALADQELIRQRAWLEIERVRLAAMRRDEPAFASAIERARATLQQWFEPRDRGTRAAMQALDSAAELDMDPDLPDISAPWAALRALRGAGLAAPDLQGQSAAATGGGPASGGGAAAAGAEADPRADSRTESGAGSEAIPEPPPADSGDTPR